MLIKLSIKQTVEPSIARKSHGIDEDHLQKEGHNLIVLALQNVVLRIGWIFKTESVIMPAFLDIIAGAGWMRGCLPVLSRIGQSVPPLLYSDRLRATPLKKRPLFITSLAMAAPFLLLSAIWMQLEEKRQPWLAILFLVLYFIFFSATGLNQITFGTLQGKLIRPQRRGRLLGIGGILGSIGAVSAALIWLRPWLTMPNNEGFTYVFLFNGLAFLAAGVVSLFCIEYPDEEQELPRIKLFQPFVTAWNVYRHDGSFRRVAHVAILFMCSLLIFPHYQWLGREVLNTDNADLIQWVIVQNISVGLYSPALGWVADRFGNRLALRIGVIAVSTTPVVATLFAFGYVEQAADWYWLTFVILGLTPVVMKMFLNYTLELTAQEQHSRYLSTMRICFAVPFFLSPVVGWLVDSFPFQYTFVAVSMLVLAGGLLTFLMEEPRHSGEE